MRRPPSQPVAATMAVSRRASYHRLSEVLTVELEEKPDLGPRLVELRRADPELARRFGRTK